ncbi:MAG: methylated-DNA--[protein]-cysteine S-methyltransferase [Erysipelotrichaceae bacterium]|nr:methylated-DNA--[protein]-cysteine S-methyltransferase [Erysipelotrichaceae bacterium]
MNSAVYKTFFGYMRITCEDDTLLEIRRVYEEDPCSCPSPATDRVAQQLQEYFRGQRKNFDLQYRIEGTDFQKRVLEALKEIPYGETRSYQEVAAMTGRPRAFRAVGNAVHVNKLMFILPCHRVIKADGKLGGYAGDEDLKLALLELEQQYR